MQSAREKKRRGSMYGKGVREMEERMREGWQEVLREILEEEGEGEEWMKRMEE